MPDVTVAQNAPTTALTPVDAPKGGSGGSAARAAALKARLAEGGDVAGPEASAPAEPANVAGAPEAPSMTEAAPRPANDAARAERMARLAKVREREAADKAERQRREAAKVSSQEVETLRKRVAELEPTMKVFESEDALLAEAERRGMTAEKLVAWMRTRLTDPAAVAERHARTEADKIREELAAERKAREDLEARLRDEQEASRSTSEAQQRAAAFIERAAHAKADYPLSASLLERHGPHGLINFCGKFIVPLLREDYTLDELHDHTEQFLDEVQLAGGRITAGPEASPANPASTKKGAAKPSSTTLSNAVASQRASVEEEIPLHKLPKKDRIARLRAKLASE